MIRLHSVTRQSYPGLSDAEASALASFAFADNELGTTAAVVRSAFSDSLSGLPQLYEKAHRLLSQGAVRRVIHPYRRRDSGDPEAYFKAKYEALFELLELPFHALGYVDGNLTNYLPNAAHRKEAFRSVARKRRSLAKREL